MFIVMFEFVVKNGFEEQFLATWSRTTQGIYLFKGSLGSRLHRTLEGDFIDYAQWPDEDTYRQSAHINMDEKFEAQRQLMHDSLNLTSTKVLYEMEVEQDYLHPIPFAV